jgi:hypothetical protein
MTRIHPGLPVKAVGSGNRYTVNDDRRMVETVVEVGPEVWEQYRTGYRCVRCHAVQEEPFPERCIESQYGICHFPIRERQLEELEWSFVGDVTHPGDPEVDWEKWDAEEGQQIWTPSPEAPPPDQIWLPE